MSVALLEFGIISTINEIHHPLFHSTSREEYSEHHNKTIKPQAVSTPLAFTVRLFHVNESPTLFIYISEFG